MDHYEFDAEVFEISTMYEDFLKGVAPLIPGIAITDIVEDLSRMTEEMDFDDCMDGPPTDGKRSVSFKCNGTPYEIELDSYGDWFNFEMLEFFNRVLLAEHYPGRICFMEEPCDQVVALIYTTEEDAPGFPAY